MLISADQLVYNLGMIEETVLAKAFDDSMRSEIWELRIHSGDGLSSIIIAELIRESVEMSIQEITPPGWPRVEVCNRTASNHPSKPF